jgi:two-component system, OmpR family, alkaline phosphatase synthesis response regulator PhoP
VLNEDWGKAMNDETKKNLDADADEVSSAASGKTILVADDESHILHVVSLKLRNAGFRVVTARDGQEAFEMATQEHPDLIITDYHMPQLSGLELCRKLKQDPATRNIPAIMLTARGYHLEPHDTEQSGILRMLSKPFSPRHLLATVNEVLANAA